MGDSRKDQVDRYERYVKRILEVIGKLDRPTLTHLVRASEETSEIDGYGQGGSSERVSGGGRPNEGGSTAAAVIAMVCGRCEGEGRIPHADHGTVKCRDCGGTGERSRVDPLMAALENIFGSLAEMAGHSEIIAKRVPVVVFANSKLQGRVDELKQCHACHRDVACTTADPMRVGYCKDCAFDWYRWKEGFAPDEVATARRFFEDQRPKFEGHHEAACEMCAYLAELKKKPVAAAS